MDIIILEPHCNISVVDHVYLRFTSDQKDVVHRLSAIRSIQINESTSLDAEVLQAVLSYNIRLSLVDKDGDALGEWHTNRPSKTIQLKYKQMRYIYKGYGYSKAAEWICHKIKSQFDMMNSYDIMSAVMIEKFKYISQAWSSDNVDVVYHEEPNIAKHYYRLISSILPPEFSFDRRSRQPAVDPYNALVNYSYSYLYRLVEDAIVTSGLDPYLGFYHSNQKGGKALVYDMIEPFRPWIDARVINLLMAYSRDIDQDFTYDQDACLVSQSIKRMIMSDIAEHFMQTIRYNNRTMTMKNHVYATAKTLKVEIEKYATN